MRSMSLQPGMSPPFSADPCTTRPMNHGRVCSTYTRAAASTIRRAAGTRGATSGGASVIGASLRVVYHSTWL